MIFDRDRARDAVLGRAPVIVAQPGADVARPGGDDGLHAAGADELIKENVGDRADERQIALVLADELVAGGERDERFERQPERDRGAVGDVLRDRIAHGHELGLHVTIRNPYAARPSYNVGPERSSGTFARAFARVLRRTRFALLGVLEFGHALLDVRVEAFLRVAALEQQLLQLALDG